MGDVVHRDRALVRRMLAGDEAAFETVFRSQFPALFRFALVRLGHNEDLAEEMVQATLCKAMTKLQTYRGEAALFTWLCTFCRHEISAYFRRDGKRHATALVEEIPEIRSALESLAHGPDGPETRMKRKDVARLVQVTLDHLPPHYGQALTWKYIEGLPVKEIAQRLDLGPKAAESLLTRARQAFRDGFAALTGGDVRWALASQGS